MSTKSKIEKVISKYKSKAIIFRQGKCWIVSNFPEKVEQPIIDYIDCNYSISEQSNFSVRFT